MRSNGVSIFWTEFSNSHSTSSKMSEKLFDCSPVFVQAVLRNNFSAVKNNVAFFIQHFNVIFK